MKGHIQLYTELSTNVRINDASRQLKQLTINTMGLFFPQKTKSLIKQLFFKPTRKELTADEQHWIDISEIFKFK